VQVHKLEVVRWQEPVPPQEQELRRRIAAEGLSSYAWSNAPGDSYAVHSHSYEKILYCIQGSIRFILPDAPETIEYIDLAPGDCMYLPPKVRHGALVGPQGVICLEASRYS
jgi:quercetin dioxygenase-like cupin family protein